MQRDTEYLIKAAKDLKMTPEEYRNSRERVLILNSIIKDVSLTDVDAIGKYVKAVVQETGEEVKQKLLDPRCDPNVLRGLLRGAILFQEKIEKDLRNVRIARERLEQIKKSQKE